MYLVIPAIRKVFADFAVKQFFIKLYVSSSCYRYISLITRTLTIDLSRVYNANEIPLLFFSISIFTIIHLSFIYNQNFKINSFLRSNSYLSVKNPSSTIQTSHKIILNEVAFSFIIRQPIFDDRFSSVPPS